MNDDERKMVRKWITRQLRNGMRVSALHEMVDAVAESVLYEALDAERRERHRADSATVERDDAVEEIERLRSGLSALAPTGKEDS